MENDLDTAILVDTSYLVYYSGFAVYQWYKNEFGLAGKPSDGTFDPMTDPEYKAMFKKHFLNRIFNVVHNEVVFFDRSSLIFCKDCRRKKIWRMDVFPEYKLMRAKKKADTKKFDWHGIFTYVNNVLLPDFEERYGSKIIEHPAAEGDDIIASLTNKLYDEGKRNIIIIASDGDICQLSDKSTIITLKGEHKTYQSVLAKYKLKKEPKEWTPELFLLHKSIMGDGGDEIPGIMPGTGPARAVDYVNNIDKLQKLLKENVDAAEQFKINTQLINFDYIPSEISEDINKQYDAYTENSLNNL